MTAACAHTIHSQPRSVVDLRWVEPGPLCCYAMGQTARDLTLSLKCFDFNTNTFNEQLLVAFNNLGR